MAPDESMLIAGAKAKGDGTPFRVVTGHGAFVIPFVRQASFLTLAMRESEVAEHCVTTQGIALQVKAVIAFKVGNDPDSIVTAAQRFLCDQDQMTTRRSAPRPPPRNPPGGSRQRAQLAASVAVATSIVPGLRTQAIRLSDCRRSSTA